ncbi:MAG: ABC transporter permease [Gaiellales bacterium]
MASLTRGGATIVVLVALLEVLTTGFGIAPVVLQAPSAVFREIVDNVDLYVANTWTTTHEVIVGFAISAVLGVIVAIAIVYSRFLQDTVYPVVLILQIVPKVAVAPLLVVFLGFGTTPKIVIAVLIAFFPVVVNTAVGLRVVEKEMVDLVRVLNGSRLQEFTRVRVPNALPFIFSGLKLAMTFAVIGAIIGEFVGANAGLGYLIILANSQMQTDMAYAAITILSLLGLAMYGAIGLLEKLIVPWADQQSDLERA